MTVDKVVDASALAAAVFLESAAADVQRKLDGCTLHAPRLLRFEMANVGIKKIRKYPLERDAILAQHDVYRAMTIAEHDVDHAEIVLLAERLKLSAYDASYLWLARTLSAELVTLDDKLNKAAAKL